MKDSRLDILKDARQSVEKSGLDPNDREELLTLLGILISAIEKVDVPEDKGELSVSLAASLVSSQALLSLLKQQTAELDALRKLSLNLTSSLDMATVLDTISREAMRLVNNTRAVHIFLYKNENIEFGAALQSDGSSGPISTPRQDGLTYTVARGGNTIIVENIQGHPLFANALPDWNGSIIGIPLKMEETIVGVMNLSRSTTGGFSSAETRLLSMLADQAAVAISNASLHQLISRKAYSDTTTGLPNRRALDERLEKEVLHARRTDQIFAIVMMDLDGFKPVNDTWGHVFGDHVLRELARFMSESKRASDFLARYGGDELTMLVPEADQETATQTAEKIRERLTSFQIDLPNGEKHSFGLSGGIAIYPTHARTASDLLRAADTALYHAKKHARGNFVTARGFTGVLALPDNLK